MNDWPADGATKLIALELVSATILGRSSVGERWTGKEIFGVENCITQKFKCVTMQSIRAGACDNVYYPARILSVFRAVVAGLYAEFLKSVRKGKWLIDIGVLIHIVAAIQLVA